MMKKMPYGHLLGNQMSNVWHMTPVATHNIKSCHFLETINTKSQLKP